MISFLSQMVQLILKRKESHRTIIVLVIVSK